MATLDEKGYLTYYQAADDVSGLEANTWHLNSNKRHAVNVYEGFDGLKETEEKIVPKTSEPELLVLNQFADVNNTPVIFRTKLVPDATGGENVELDLDQRIVTLLMDQSGSMTWNDNDGLRFAVTNRMINRIASTYPGKVTFNVIGFNGTPINVTLFGIIAGSDLVEPDKINDIQSVNSAFFEEDESNFAGARVVRREGDFPQHPVDGEIVSEGFLSKALSDELEEGTKFFYKIFTFDKNFHFSKGVPVAATPRTRDIPRGVARFESEVLKGTGVLKDDNVIGLWHFDEGKNNVLYDFSSSKVDLTLSDEVAVWLDKDGVPIGRSGVRFDGVDTVVSSSSTSDLATDNQLTIALWVYPYDLDTKRALVGRQSSSDANYLLYLDGDKVGFYNGSASVTSISGSLKTNLWQHVAATTDYTTGEVKFYVNGENISTVILSSTSTNTSDMQIDIGFDRRKSVNAENFFGRLTEVSIHNTIRNSTYVLETSASNDDFDNGDRLVILEYDVPLDFNFSGGKVRIVKDTLEVPSWEEGGETILNTNASSGVFTLSDSEDLVSGSSINYRIFSQNATGNFSILPDSPALTVDIPLLTNIEDAPVLTQPLSMPVGLTSQKGNKKVFLKWTNFPNDTRIARVRVYYSDQEFPVADENGDFSGDLAFEGNVTDTEFVHRNIPNSISAFYGIVNIDKYGRPSDPANIGDIPAEGEDETVIPLLDVKNVTYEIVDNSSLSIIWDNPIEFKAHIDAFFGDRISIYASVTDEFGAPVSDDTELFMELSAFVDKANQSDDVFGTTAGIPTEFADSDLFTFGVTKIANGIIKGSLRMDLETGLLSAVDSVTFSIQVKSAIPDTTSGLNDDGTFTTNLFEFFSVPMSVFYENPFKLELINRDSRIIKVKCSRDLSDISFSTLIDDPTLAIEEKSFDGAYVRSTIPFVARAKISFKDAILTGTRQVRVAVWDASNNACVENFQIERFRESSVLVPPAPLLDVQTGTEEILNERGNPTGVFKDISFVDIPLAVPDLPQGAQIFVQADFGGFISTKDLPIIFENILNLELTTRAPIADGVDVAEQMATIYLIDPDDPENESKRTSPDELTTVRWTLTKKEFARDRSFFSTDSVPQPSGVFSFIRNSIARNVFFGPASGVEWHVTFDPESGSLDFIGERYEISASVVFDGLSVNGRNALEIFPIDSRSKLNSRMLMELPNFKSRVFSDGEDVVKLLISRDPNVSTTRVSSCFRSCAAQFGVDVIPLSAGQFINITTDPSIEILWGDIVEDIDPYTGNSVVTPGPNSFIEKGSAQIELLDADTTPVFFRINAFFPPSKAPVDSTENLRDSFAGLLNPCSCLGITVNARQAVEFVVNGSTTVVVNNTPKRLIGGGRMDTGVPPTIIVPREPLEIEIVDLRVNGVSSNEFVVDGTSVNEIIVEVAFAGKTVPNATPVEVSTISEKIGDISKLQFDDSIIRTRTFVDSVLDSEPRSYASLKIDPVSLEEEFAEHIIFTTRYDKSGLVERKVSECFKVEWVPGSVERQQRVPNIFSGNLDRYDISTDTWTSLTPMTNARGHLNVEFANGKLYAIGGIDTNTISQLNECYTIADDSWEFKANMPSARFGAMSVSVGSKIYIIGGMTIDKDAAQLIVSRSLEVYDTANDDWNSLSDMPVIDDNTIDGRPYGVCFGTAQHVNVGGEDRIYILSGLTEIDENGNVVKYNDRVLYYSINNGSWTVTDLFVGIELETFKRISPNSFVDGSEIVVVSGAVQIENQPIDTDIGELVYLSESYAFNIANNSLQINDFAFSEFPRPRFRASEVTDGANHYLIGGSDEKSQTLSVFERIGSNTDPFEFASLSAMLKGRAGFGAASNANQIYAAGGFVSGRDSGFLQITTGFTPSTVRLDGKQTAGITVELADEAGDAPSREVKIVMRGFIKSLTSKNADVKQNLAQVAEAQSEASQQTSFSAIDEQLSIYPVLFSSQEVTTSGGRAVVTLLARSEDILEKISDLAAKAGLTTEEAEAIVGQEEKATTGPLLKIESGKSRESYQIIVQITIDDDTLYGQTVTDLTEEFTRLVEEEEEPPVAEDAETEEPLTNVREAVSEFCNNVVEFNVALTWTSFSRGIDIGKSDTLNNSVTSLASTDGATVFSLVPSALPQANSSVVPYFSDIDWIPTINNRLVKNDSDASDVLSVLRNFENSVPFGASALFDALIDASEILSDNAVDGIKKLIYVFTDNESNLSISTIDDSIEEINAIDGFEEVPVVTGLFSIVSPATLSSKANTSDLNDLNKIADSTGGQSITVLSSEFENDIVKLFFGELAGSMGYGLYEFTYDIGSIAHINTIATFFELFTNTNGTWNISISNDGYNFTALDDTFKANAPIVFEDLNGRFIKFTIVLITGFSASNEPEFELIPLAFSPAMTHIELLVEKEKESFLFLNSETAKVAPMQIALTTNATDVNNDQIQLGVARGSISHNWLDYQTDVRPAKDHHGKMFMPIRRTDDVDELPRENLIRVDPYTFKIKYGRLNPECTVNVYDKDDKIIDASTYKVFYREGLIIFDRAREENMTFDVNNKDDFRVALRFRNRSSASPVEIFGLGYFYNTNVDLLPVAENVPPSAFDVLLSPDIITPYAAVSGSYGFIDDNFDSESTELTEIRWFINDVRISFLDNLRAWNNLENKDDPIFNHAITFSTSGLAVDEIKREAQLKNEAILRIGDSLYFTVRVSDGDLLGNIEKSNVITIAETAPIVDRTSIKSRTESGAVSNVIRGSRILFVDFDLSSDSAVNNSTIAWFVNGEEWKTGIFGDTQDVVVDDGTEEGTTITLRAEEIQPGEINGDNVLALTINNEISATVTPETGTASGTSVSSDTVVVSNSLPTVSEVLLGPTKPRATQDLVVTFTFFDYDVNVAGNLDQSNQSRVKWLKRDSGSGEFREVTEIAGQSTVPASLTSRHQQWKAEVTGSDGLDSGSPIESNLVTIL